MADPITPEDSVLTTAIKDMSFNPWQADLAPGQTPAQAYNAQRSHWMKRLHEDEPHSLAIFVENYPARSDMVGGVVLGAPEPALTEAGLPVDVSEWVQRQRTALEAQEGETVQAITKRESILRTANDIIHGDREKDYGRPVDSFTRLAEALNLVLRPKLKEGMELDAVDAAVLMIAMKLSRLAGGDRKDDTWVDLAGYSALGAEVRDQQ